MLLCVALFATLGAATAATATDSVRVAPPRVRAWMSSDSVGIGDHLRLTIEVEKDILQMVAFPDFDFSDQPDLEMVEEPTYDTVSVEDRRVTLQRNYTMRSFQEGRFEMGRMSVLNFDLNEVDTIYAASEINFDVTTFLIDSTSHSIFDLKPVWDLPFQFREIRGYTIWAVLGLILLAAIIYGILRLMAYLGRPVMGLFKTPPPLPPHVEALKELDRLRGDKLLMVGDYKSYYSRLTDILRNYIYRRYGVAAVAMSTDEIIAAMGELELPTRCEMDLKALLRDADLVKFAKWEIASSQNEAYFGVAKDFVEQTKIVEEDEDAIVAEAEAAANAEMESEIEIVEIDTEAESNEGEEGEVNK